MKITYFCNIRNKRYPCADINLALKNLGHEITLIDEKDFEMQPLLDTANKSDLFLFHTGGVSTRNEYEFQLSLARLQTILQNITSKKVMWFLDKVWGSSDLMMQQTIPFLNAAFFNDGNWKKRNKYPNTHILHCGAKRNKNPGKVVKDLECDLAFIGNIYGIRLEFVNQLKQEFGRNFKLFNDVWDEEFDDLCQSAKIIVDSQFLYEDFYWSDRIYKVLGAGGFMMHYRLHGLNDEFKDKVHYKNYFNRDELMYYLKFYLEHENERKKVAKEGRKLVQEKYTYEKRLEELFSKI